MSSLEDLHISGTRCGEEVNAAQIDWVEQQVDAVFMEHLDGDTEQFCRLLEDPKSDLVHRIAKRKKTPVGTLTRGQVRAALATIGWRAVQSLSDCFDAQMRAFQAALPEPLNHWEAAQFEIAFLKQPCFGNLPLLLLKDRISFIRDAVLDIFEKPDDLRSIAVFHRMLSYYDHMMGKRRAADRRYQQRRLSTNDDGRAADQVHLLRSAQPMNPARAAKLPRLRSELLGEWLIIRAERSKCCSRGTVW